MEIRLRGEGQQIVLGSVSSTIILEELLKQVWIHLFVLFEYI